MYEETMRRRKKLQQRYDKLRKISERIFQEIKDIREECPHPTEHTVAHFSLREDGTPNLYDECDVCGEIWWQTDIQGNI